MKPFVPKLKSYFAVKYDGLDADGNPHVFTTDIDGYDKVDAMKKLQKNAEVYGITIVKVSNFTSFADPAGALWQVEVWNQALIKEKNGQS